MARATAATKEKPAETDIADQATSKGEVAIFQPPRLPYHPAVEERFGVDKGQWKVLVEAIFPSAKTVDAIVMALSYCQHRKLDVFKRPVHIVPMWDSQRGAYVETVWPGISELRTTASRTKGYAGVDEAEFGPIKTVEFEGRVKIKGEWKTEKFKVEFPAWCRLTVYRMVDGHRCKFVGPKVSWLETYATQGASELPNKMWQERPEGQLEKCAEAGALRRAFPEELGNELTAEEMIGRHVQEGIQTAEPAQIAPDRDPAPPREAPKAAEPPADSGQATQEKPADTGPPRTAAKPEATGAAPQRDAAPPRSTAPQQRPAAADETKPHRIPGDGHSFETWTAKYVDLIQTSADVAAVYGWIDANTKEYTLPEKHGDKRFPGPLTRLSKDRPSEYAKAKAAAERTIERLRPKNPPKETKAAPPAEMDEGGDMGEAPAGNPDARSAGPANPESVLKQIDAELSAVEDPDQLQAVWERACDPLLADLFPPDQDEAQALFHKHEKRLGGD